MTHGRQIAKEARALINDSMGFVDDLLFVKQPARNALMALVFSAVSQAEMSQREALGSVLQTEFHRRGAEAIVKKWLADCQTHRIKVRLRKKTRKRLLVNLTGMLTRLDPEKVKRLIARWTNASSN